MTLEWDPVQLVTGNVQKGKSESATSLATLRNLVRSTAFVFVWVGLFTSLENDVEMSLWLQLPVQRGLVFAKASSLDGIAPPNDHCVLRWEEGIL